jgi:hypothetical protein
MNRKIRLIWNFRGPDALETAKHHVIHLKEFSVSEKLSYHETNVIEENPYLCIAFIIINENDLTIYKDALKPDRGTVVN